MIRPEASDTSEVSDDIADIFSFAHLHKADICDCSTELLSINGSKYYINLESHFREDFALHLKYTSEEVMVREILGKKYGLFFDTNVCDDQTWFPYIPSIISKIVELLGLDYCDCYVYIRGSGTQLVFPSIIVDEMLHHQIYEHVSLVSSSGLCVKIPHRVVFMYCSIEDTRTLRITLDSNNKMCVDANVTTIDEILGSIKNRDDLELCCSIKHNIENGHISDIKRRIEVWNTTHEDKLDIGRAHQVYDLYVRGCLRNHVLRGF